MKMILEKNPWLWTDTQLAGSPKQIRIFKLFDGLENKYDAKSGWNSGLFAKENWHWTPQIIDIFL